MTTDAKSFFKKANKKKRKLKMLLGGASGAGKTYSALKIAKGFLGSLDNVAVLDTEDSADVYSQLGDYSVLEMNAPFDPRRYEKAIDLAIEAGLELIIIDSITKEWNGEGGCLDLHEKFGGRYQDWSKVTPLHDSFLQKIVHAPIHIICTTRKKQDYAMVEKNGRTTVEKMGLQNVQRDGAEYEFSCALDLDINHVAQVNKDRTFIFEELCPVVLSEQHGELLHQWCEGER